MLVSETLKQLILLLADGKFHSGSELSAVAAISRTGVWKHLQVLPGLGLELAAVPGKGYKLIQALDLLDHQRIVSWLSPEAERLISRLEVHDSIDSTSVYLQDQAKCGAVTGTVCLAEFQTAGKGRRGRQWLSPFGNNIYLSILWRYQTGPAGLAGLSLALGVATVRALTEFGLHEIGLKWPNDVLSQKRKLAGILVDVAGENGGPCDAVIGIGVNFYLSAKQIAEIDQPCATIQQLLGDAALQRRNQLTALLLNQLLPVIAEFESVGVQRYVDEWRRYDCMLGQHATLYQGSSPQSGTLAGIDNSGLLLLRLADGSLKRFASGEVSSSLL
jgi:BirA family transcriptional regulator, biotin operon repressor / biotin---[acetyl-CoA-carboxylase] ligase